MPDAFNNGLNETASNFIDEIDIEISRARGAIAELPRHRSLSLAITKLEEAQHWLRDRKKKPANE